MLPNEFRLLQKYEQMQADLASFTKANEIAATDEAKIDVKAQPSADRQEPEEV